MSYADQMVKGGASSVQGILCCMCSKTEVIKNNQLQGRKKNIGAKIHHYKVFQGFTVTKTSSHKTVSLWHSCYFVIVCKSQEISIAFNECDVPSGCYQATTLSMAVSGEFCADLFKQHPQINHSSFSILGNTAENWRPCASQQYLKCENWREWWDFVLLIWQCLGHTRILCRNTSSLDPSASFHHFSGPNNTWRTQWLQLFEMDESQINPSHKCAWDTFPVVTLQKRPMSTLGKSCTSYKKAKD